MKMLGGLLLIIGTTIGAGMLALPIACASMGFVPSLMLLTLCWLFVTYGALLLLEVTLCFPEKSNLIRMAQGTLGPFGAGLTWLSYLALLYCLLAAFISGGADLTYTLLEKGGWHFSMREAAILFTLGMGLIVFLGIRSVDVVNRGLMFVKIGCYGLLIALIAPHVHAQHLQFSNTQALGSGLSVAITSFSFAIIVPSLRDYFKEDAPRLLNLILWGSVIPLLCYSLWNYVVLGTIPLSGPQGLQAISHSGHAISTLTATLSDSLKQSRIVFTTHLFTSVCMLTAFLSVSLALSDFLADGLSLPKSGKRNHVSLFGSTFLPPLLLNLFYPEAFLLGLGFAGVFCVILLVFIPTWMAWRARYTLALPSSLEIPGGKPALGIMFFLCTIVFFLCILSAVGKI